MLPLTSEEIQNLFFSRLRIAQTDVQFTQLLFFDRSRSVGQQALSTLSLREGDHVTDGRSAGHDRDDTIETEGDTTMGRRTVLQIIEQEAELGTGFFRTDIQSGEHLALDVCAVNTDGAATDFPTV